MADYVYKSNEIPSDDYIEEECIPEEVQASTTLDELDELEIINRNADEFNKIPTIDNPYPDVLKKPIFTRTIPQSEPPKSISHPSIVRKPAFKDMSIKEFSNTIANSLIEIIHDILNYNQGDDLTEIFTKDSRLLSIGVLLLIISIFFIFFKNVD